MRQKVESNEETLSTDTCDNANVVSLAVSDTPHEQIWCVQTLHEVVHNFVFVYINVWQFRAQNYKCKTQYHFCKHNTIFITCISFCCIACTLRNSQIEITVELLYFFNEVDSQNLYLFFTLFFIIIHVHVCIIMVYNTNLWN